MMLKIWVIFCLFVMALARDNAEEETNKNNDESNSVALSSTKEKKSRFISFDNDHGDVKIELDFAVPFMRIPVKPKSLGAAHSGAAMDPLLEVNTRGLVTVGTILFFLVTLVPKLVKIFIPQAQASIADGVMPLMARIDDALHMMNPSTECYQRTACWLGKNTSMNPMYLSQFSIPEWLKEALTKPGIQEAFQRGQNGEECSAYQCSMSLQTLTKILEVGKDMMGKDNRL